MGGPGRARVLVYSHDTYGLGHLRRSMLVAERLASMPRVGSVLIVTGSPKAQAFRLPPGCDTVKLPSVTKTQAGRYRARTLSVDTDDIIRMRSALTKSTFDEFRPDLVLVDHAPLGMLGELRPVLDAAARRPNTAFCLGLRDVIDEAARVTREWSRLDAWGPLGAIYDRILVYGDPSVQTTAQELGLDGRFPGKVAHVGYLGRTIRDSRDPADPMLLVTTGGGGDGHDLLRAYAAFIESLAPPFAFRSVIVGGPLMSQRRNRELAARFAKLSHRVEFVGFTDRMDDLLSSASGIVSMAGYNTVAEALSRGIPALLVPRERPRLEQRIRAQRVASRVPTVEWCSVRDCTPERIARFVKRAVDATSDGVRCLDLDGVDATVAELLRLLDAGVRERIRQQRVPVPA